LNKLEELYDLLSNDGIEIDGIELAETLWLSQYISKTKINPEIDNSVITDSSNESFKNTPSFDEEILKSNEKEKNNTEQINKTLPLYPNSRENTEDYLPFRTPLVRKLYKDNSLIYAFRHFRQKVISTKKSKLDEEKIADYILQTNIFMPFYKKNYDKRFNLIFMVDNSESMDIWKTLIDDFIKDVNNYNIFKKTTTYYIDTDFNIPKFYRKRENKSQINDTWYKSIEKNTLVFMFSDMISKSWVKGKLLDDISLWQKYLNFAIIQMLPRRLWNNTKLIDASIDKMSNTKKFALNDKLKSRSEEILSIEEVLPELIKIPLLNFNENSISVYGRVINSLPKNRIEGALFEKDDFQGDYQFSISSSDIDSQDRLKSFYKYASNLSKELLELISVVPLSLSIIKLIQQNFLPKSTQEHLSEILISNIIDKEQKIDGFYQFYKAENEQEGVREKLIKKIGAKKAFSTIVMLSEVIHKQGAVFDFLSYVVDPSILNQSNEFSEIDREFARVSSSVLKEMGGNYLKLVERLENDYIYDFNEKSLSEDIITNKLNSKNMIRIVVLGVGGAGCNMINHMVTEGFSSVDLIAANTDLQVLKISKASKKILLGANTTKGLGAMMRPEIGRDSAIESYEEIKSALEGSDIVFVAGGLGGGTGTGAMPVIAQIAKEIGALTISVITKPFTWEGKKRTHLAKDGLEQIKKTSDSIILITNDRLLEVIDEDVGMKDAFKIIDNILLTAVKGIFEVSINPNNSNLNTDLEDIKTVMKHKGLSLIGMAKYKGAKATIRAFEKAIDSPLLENITLNDAKGIIIHFTLHPKASIFAVNDVMSRIDNSLDSDADIIFGTTIDSSLEFNEVKVIVIATGIDKKKLTEKVSDKSHFSWDSVISEEKQKDYYKKLREVIDKRYETTTVFPPKNKIFNAFSQTPIENLKVVILGQDPYHGFGQAQGLAFSTPSEIKNPPSMINILKEIENDLGAQPSCKDGDLTPWAQDGVLLLNTVLTVEESKPKSHHKLGWEVFTDNIIKYISENLSDVVFLLWGSPAIEKSKLIDKSKHHVLTAPHPSPLSAYRGFFGCKHFSKTNKILNSIGKKEINWISSKRKEQNSSIQKNSNSNITFDCEDCKTSYSLSCDELDWEQIGGSERNMGSEIEYEAKYHKTCNNCSNEMKIFFSCWEYPLGVENHRDILGKGVINLLGNCCLDFNKSDEKIINNDDFNRLEQKKRELEDLIINLTPYSELEYINDSGEYSNNKEISSNHFLISYNFDSKYLKDLIYEIQEDIDEISFILANDSNSIDDLSLLLKKQYIIEYEAIQESYGVDRNCNVYKNDSEQILYVCPPSQTNIDKLDKEKDLVIQEMKEWFLDNYDDPANILPYETREGGYQYLFGGPYELHDILYEQFSSQYSNNYIDQVINSIENEYGVMDWEKRPNEDDFLNELADELKSDLNKLNVNSDIKNLLQIDGEFNGWSGDTVVKLTNGEIWKQTEYFYEYIYAYMPKVSLLSSSLGYKMKVDGSNIEVGVEKLNNVIESKINGDFNGWNGDTIIELINGQEWKQLSSEYSYSYGYNPSVIIFQSGLGYKIKVEGNDNIVDIERIS